MTIVKVMLITFRFEVYVVILAFLKLLMVYLAGFKGGEGRGRRGRGGFRDGWLIDNLIALVFISACVSKL